MKSYPRPPKLPKEPKAPPLRKMLPRPTPEVEQELIRRKLGPLADDLLEANRLLSMGKGNPMAVMGIPSLLVGLFIGVGFWYAQFIGIIPHFSPLGRRYRLLTDFLEPVLVPFWWLFWSVFAMAILEYLFVISFELPKVQRRVFLAMQESGKGSDQVVLILQGRHGFGKVIRLLQKKNWDKEYRQNARKQREGV